LGGAEAFVALVVDGELAEVAAGVDWTAAELTSTLLNDPAVFVSPNGQVGFADPAPAPRGEVALDPVSVQAPTANIWTLHSQPAAALTIFLDFDGHVTRGTLFNTHGDSDPSNDVAAIASAPFDRDGKPGSLSAAEAAEIEAVWQIVAEDYAPFNVDVTTEDPGAGALEYSGDGDTEYGTRIVISPTDEWVGKKYGGVAYVGSFKWNTPAFVFSGNLATFKSVGDAASHEAGHALGLAHDGTPQGGYYTGHDAWGTIMGNSYTRELAQWSKGEYTGANNPEDDVAMLAASLGYRNDDHGNTTATATLLSGTGAAAGFVGAGDPADVFVVDVVGGGIDARVTPVSTVTNLFAAITIRNSAGTVVAENTPGAVASATTGYGNHPIDWAARATALVPDGRYTVEVRPAGLGTPSTGFSTYGSNGGFVLALVVGADVRPPIAGQVRFTPIQPVRLADTRSGAGGGLRLAAEGVLRVPVAGTNGLPSDVTAAALNVTAVGPETDGFLSVFPCSEVTPTTSTLNFAAARDIANSTIATLAADGSVCVYSSAATDVIVDITGWFSPRAATAMSVTASLRAADTRSGVGGSGRLTAGGVLTLAAADVGVSAVGLNVTAVGADQAGFLTVYPCGTALPVASTVNYAAGEARPNNTIVAVAPGGLVCVFSSSDVDVIVDVTALFSAAGQLEYVPTQPNRLIDTRASGPVAAGGEIAFDVPSPGVNPGAVSVNVTATGHDVDGFSTAFGCDTGVPNASTINQRVGEADANGAIVPIGAGSTGCVFTSSETNLIVDLNGWWVPAG
jgi:hypothetical protein